MNVGEVESDRRVAHARLANAGLTDLDLFVTQLLGAAQLVDAHRVNLCHARIPDLPWFNRRHGRAVAPSEPAMFSPRNMISARLPTSGARLVTCSAIRMPRLSSV